MTQYNILNERRFTSGDNSERSHFAAHDRAQTVLSAGSFWHSQYLPPASTDAAIQPFPSINYQFTTPTSGWPVEHSVLQASYPPSPSQHSTTQFHSNFVSSSDYPESSQRTIVHQSPVEIDPASLPSFHYQNDLSRSPSQSPDRSPKHWSDDLYSLDDSHPRKPSSPPQPAVKVEPDDPDGCFIMELACSQDTHSARLSQSLAPPTEVPLRATQAPEEMREMMGVFRINPFAMHSGEGRGVVPSSWGGGEARPLDAEPLVFEFQVDMSDSTVASPKDQLRSFSPDFELHRGTKEQDDVDQRSDWSEYCSESAYTTTTWGDVEFSAGEEQFAPDYPQVLGHPRHSRMHGSVSHPYLRKHSYDQNSQAYSTGFTGSSSSLDISHVPAPRASSEWLNVIYRELPPSRCSTYASSESPGCDTAAFLPSHVISHGTRRWSLPDEVVANLGTSTSFLN